MHNLWALSGLASANCAEKIACLFLLLLLPFRSPSSTQHAQTPHGTNLRPKCVFNSTLVKRTLNGRLTATAYDGIRMMWWGSRYYSTAALKKDDISIKRVLKSIPRDERIRIRLNRLVVCVAFYTSTGSDERTNCADQLGSSLLFAIE